MVGLGDTLACAFWGWCVGRAAMSKPGPALFRAEDAPEFHHFPALLRRQGAHRPEAGPRLLAQFRRHVMEMTGAGADALALLRAHAFPALLALQPLEQAHAGRGRHLVPAIPATLDRER